jgi:hypothetical protein
MQPRLALNFQSSCLSLTSAGITDESHHIWLVLTFLTKAGRKVGRREEGMKKRRRKKGRPVQ